MIPTKRQWKRWSFPTKLGVASAYLGILGFGLSIFFYVVPNTSLKKPELPALPDGSGWLLLGDFDAETKTYIRGPFYRIADSSYPEKSEFPRKGEILEITTERNLIVADFKKSGTTKMFQPPWQENILDEDDYTGIKIKPGSEVEVRDVSAGHFPGMPYVVWVRIGHPPK